VCVCVCERERERECPWLRPGSRGTQAGPRDGCGANIACH